MAFCTSLAPIFLFGLLFTAAEGGANQPSNFPVRQELAFGPAAVGLAMGGCGGAYFLAEAGTLIIEVQKQELNRSDRPTELRAILAGPDREVLAEVFLPEDKAPRGKPGPIQIARLEAPVARKGIYVLNITVSQDRYGEAMYWSFRTNCPKYLVETSRGHRDAPHEEPLVLHSPERPIEVCFIPRKSGFSAEIRSNVAPGEDSGVWNARGELVAPLKPAEDGVYRTTVSGETMARDPQNPWRLYLPAGTFRVDLDGLTRWNQEDLYRDLCCWTPQQESFYPLLDYRWLLTPYQRLVYCQPEESREISLRVHNNSQVWQRVLFSLEFPEAPWPVELSAQILEIPPKRAEELKVRFRLPAGRPEVVVHLRATPESCPEFSTFSTLRVKSGSPPAANPLELPVVLKPYRHQNELFGYLPDYPTDAEIYFDPQNRPYTLSGDNLYCLKEGRWESISVSRNTRWSDGSNSSRGPGPISPKIAFDQDGDIYLLGGVGNRRALLHCSDGGRSFTAYPLPDRGATSQSMDMEVFCGHNPLSGPPPILRYVFTGRDPKLFWRYLHTLELFVPKKQGGAIVLGDPVILSEECLGLSSHSGSPISVVSRDGKVHVVWAQATDPAVKVPGTPAYANTYDVKTGHLGKPVLVGYGPPANDIHNSPSIAIDSRGYLHVLGGTHGAPFPYAVSRQPNDTQAGFSEAVPVADASLTYIGMVCGPDDTLHVMCRMWQYNKEPFPQSHHATLVYLRKRPGEAWEMPRILVVPPLSEYSVFYHRLTISRTGRLVVSHDCWSTFWFYRLDQPGHRRAVMTSADGGQTWKLAETSDFSPNGG